MSRAFLTNLWHKLSRLSLQDAGVGWYNPGIAAFAPIPFLYGTSSASAKYAGSGACVVAASARLVGPHDFCNGHDSSRTIIACVLRIRTRFYNASQKFCLPWFHVFPV